MASRGISRETAERFKLGVTDKGALAIPYLNQKGAWHLKYRCMKQHDCKTEGHERYWYDPGTEQHLFNCSTLLDAQFVIVTEGELDAITAEQYGIRAVGYPGATQWRGHAYWRHCLESCEEVLVVADGDDAGMKAAGVVVESLRDAVTHGDVRCVQMPEGHDVNSFVNEFGETELLQELGWL